MSRFAREEEPVRSRHAARRPPPPNYYGRREQLRLFVLCATFMLVLVMMNEARKPSTWAWMWGETSTDAAAERIDTRLQLAPVALPADGFQAESVPRSPDETEDVPPAGNTHTALFAGISTELLSSIEDNAVLKARENDAWWTILGLLKRRSPEDLHRESSAELSFSQLFHQMDVYRGQLVTVRGTFRRLESVQPRENDQGVEALYRWILQPATSANLPIVIYSLERPTGLDPGPLDEPGSVTGVCFKRWAYAAADGPRVAPLLLAKTVDWQPGPQATAAPLPRIRTLVWLAVGLACGAIALAWVVYRTSLAHRPELARLRYGEGPLEEIPEDDVLPGVHEALDRLAERDP